MMRRFDRPFLVAVVLLVIVGSFIFLSASLGLLTRNGASFADVAFSHFGQGLLGGIILLLITSRIPYAFWRKYAFYIFLGSVLATLLVFIPSINLEAGGAKRWILIGPLSFQPAELLKLGFIIYLAAWLSAVRKRIETFRYGILPFVAMSAVAAGIFMAQPDYDTLAVLVITGGCMLFVSGTRLRHLALLGTGAVIFAVLVALFVPHVHQRVVTYFDPAADPQGSSYQIQQSLIAIGSGGLWGRGFGQSVQKFNFLPEPNGDSIFAVAAEEFGFVGGVVIIGLFLFLAFRGLRIAAQTPDLFGGLLALGIVIMIVLQSFMNIAAMLNIIPLSGMPLLFMSHGGSALLLALAEIGIVLNISTYRRNV
jgi:cell division protein FtsW